MEPRYEHSSSFVRISKSDRLNRPVIVNLSSTQVYRHSTTIAHP